jgi:hypothetical protein
MSVLYDHSDDLDVPPTSEGTRHNEGLTGQRQAAELSALDSKFSCSYRRKWVGKEREWDGERGDMERSCAGME